MNAISNCALALLLAITPAEFARYRAEAPLTRTAAKPDVRSGRAHLYRTVLREEAKEGVNFNGHYRIASWGCGTNCIEWAVIDLAVGRVWMAPAPLASNWSMEDQPAKTPDWMEFYSASSLFYVHTSEGRRSDRTFDTRRAYVWRGGEPRLLRKEALDY
jgi:hypothetical protein